MGIEHLAGRMSKPAALEGLQHRTSGPIIYCELLKISADLLCVSNARKWMSSHYGGSDLRATQESSRPFIIKHTCLTQRGVILMRRRVKRVASFFVYSIE